MEEEENVYYSAEMAMGKILISAATSTG